MNVSPTVGVWCNFIALVLAGIGAGSVEFGNLSDVTVTLVKTVAADGLFLLTCANLVFHLYSSTAPGPLASDKT